jgi:iron complex transport system ATP-binding protein
MMPYRIELDHVDFSWPGASPTIDALSGTIEEGIWLALIGPNGAGKTTLLRLLAGLNRPASGAIRIAGRSLATYRSMERAVLIALMPQNIGQGFDLTVKSVVELGRIGQYRWWDRLGYISRQHQEAVEQALWATDTESLADRRFTELSGGEARRVLLAMVLAQQTPILLLDEPTAYLDPGHASDILERVQRLVHEQRKTVIMAYHDLTTVGLYCDEIWALKGGRLVLAGPAVEVVTDPDLKTLYAVELVTINHPRRNRPVVLLP